MPVEIREHALGSKDAYAAFLAVQDLVYQGDPAYVPPLRMELKDRLTPGKNPLWEHAEGTLFTAYRDGKLVGRASAQIDREHLRIHQDDAGFFGFLDTLDDQEVADALLDAAAKWLRARGMKIMRGPFNFTINEECGMLVDGFDTPPALMMAHHRPYQHRLVEAAGFEKAKDLLAWKYEVAEPPPRAQRAWEQMNALPEVRFRDVDPGKMREELDSILEIFNDAWANNWGFVPATEAEIEKMAEDFKLLIDPRLAFFAEVKGRPVGMVICLPNLPEILGGSNGSLFPTLWAKLLWHLKIKKDIRSGRLMLLGIRQEMRGIKRYGALSTAMYAELAHRGLEHGFQWAELSWTLEDNRPINLGIQAMRGKVYKTYRVYEKAL
ncbi:MAG: hypothetical protein H6721_24660 [Sandaracinus sp.]|nr:hypothetical protein [Sandaracinus sp.]MCB9623624.1 hypothetical protein [Sandaracinus sp.]MCB9635325.1 hypothetical protein [Sandaracinus sp.]